MNETCFRDRLGGSPFTAPQTSTLCFRPPAWYVTTALPSRPTLSVSVELLRAMSWDACAVAGSAADSAQATRQATTSERKRRVAAESAPRPP